MSKNIQHIRDLLAAGRPLDALAVAARWPTLGVYRDDITRGWAAYRNPTFYWSIDQDPDKLIAAGVAAVRQLAAAVSPSTDCQRPHPHPGCACLACRRAAPKTTAVSPRTRKGI